MKPFSMAVLVLGVSASCLAHAADPLDAWPPVVAQLARDVSACKAVPNIAASIEALKASRLVDPKPVADQHEERIYRLASPVVVHGAVAFDRVGFYGMNESDMAFAGFLSPAKPRDVVAALKAAGLRSQAKAKSKFGPALTTITSRDDKGTYWVCGHG